MRAILVFFLFVVITFFVGAILAFPLKLLLDTFLDLAFRKYLTYATLISGLIVSGFYLHIYNLLSVKAFGYSGSFKTLIKTLVHGFIYGVMIMLSIEVMLLLLGIHEIDTNRSVAPSAIGLLFIKSIVAGLLISLLEESIFRGALFSGLHKKTGAIVTVFFTSAIYAAVHFIRYPDLPPGTEIGWFTGISMLPDAFRRFYEWSILDYFLTLFVFGVFLSLLRLRHKNLAACIGAHAGVVMLIKISKYFTNRTHDSSFDYLVSQYNATFGWISFTVMLLVTIFYFVKSQTKLN